MRITTVLHAAAGFAALAVAHVVGSQTTATGKPRYGAFGVDLTARDPGVKPGDDFWTYANGVWSAKTAIPADKGGYGVGTIVSDEADANVRKILDEMAANPAQYGAMGKKVGDFYSSWMNAAAIEAKGT